VSWWWCCGPCVFCVGLHCLELDDSVLFFCLLKKEGDVAYPHSLVLSDTSPSSSVEPSCGLNNTCRSPQCYRNSLWLLAKRTMVARGCRKSSPSVCSSPAFYRRKPCRSLIGWIMVVSPAASHATHGKAEPRRRSWLSSKRFYFNIVVS
jgi:hypothetical protein